MNQHPITFLSHNALDHTLTFALSGRRYEYQFHFPADLDTALYLIRKVSVGKGYAYTKKRGYLIGEAA